MTKQIEINGKKIIYDVHGLGKPVMLVHGFGETRTVWKNQITFLKDDFQLIVPDLPGSGESEMVDDMSMEGMAEVLRNILDLECGDLLQTKPVNSAPTMIGHSMGGYITLAFASRYPDYLAAFGLFSFIGLCR